MDTIAGINAILNIGAAGAVIFIVMQFLKYGKDRDAAYQKQIQEIVDRHTAEERLARAQLAELFGQTRSVFDRIIGICADLTAAVGVWKDASVQSAARTDAAVRDLATAIQRLEGGKDKDATP